MKRKLLSLLLLAGGLTGSQIKAQTLHHMKIVLDTKKFNNINCSLNSPCDGVTPTPLNKVYMHAGVCWYDGNSAPGTVINNGVAEFFCIQQIVPLNSEVWQSVVGNWGTNPQDDNVGVMVNEGNGIFTKEFDIETYFSSSDVSTELNPVSNITSMPMNPNATPYTMGLVFRDPTGLISGRDSTCQDIFIWKLATTPEVIQSDFSNWSTGPISFQYNLANVKERDLAYGRQIYPNPMNESVQIKFYLAASQQDFEMNVFDAMGRKVKTIYRGQLPAGSQTATWDAVNDEGNRVEPGVYFFTMRSGTSVVTDRLILTR